MEKERGYVGDTISLGCSRRGENKKRERTIGPSDGVSTVCRLCSTVCRGCSTLRRRCSTRYGNHFKEVDLFSSRFPSNREDLRRFNVELGGVIKLDKMKQR
ncbi:uncharacterized protein LOC143152838 [Ptiloglossa arizonensis]|uniref:uncharacterized protein LOC143152838 n=1 Tax=Ptiloglossa arizonensis TaxID=3350558 RepID=UPI003F9F0CEB